MSFFELISGHGLNIFPVSLGSCFGIGHHERQFKHFNAREATCRVAWKCPNDVHHAIARLIVKLNGRTAQLHGGIGFKLDTAA